MSTYKIQLRGDTAANWASVNPILSEREFALETDTLKYKIGNGILAWNSLPYASIDVSAGSNIDITGGVVSVEDNVEVVSISATTGVFTTLSGGTIFSGGTNLYSIFAKTTDVPTRYDYDLIVAASDETTQLTSGATKVTFYAPRSFTLTGATATLTTSGSTNTVVDLNYNGSTVFASPITLANTIFFNTSATTTTNIIQNGIFTVDIDSAGTGAKGLKVALLGYKSF